MSAHVLLNLLNDLGKRDKMRGLLEHFIPVSQHKALDSLNVTLPC